MSKSEHTFPGFKFLIGLASLMIVAAGLRASQTFMIPFLFALFLATLGTPPARYLKRIGIPKIISVLVVALVIISLLVFVGSLL
ncbi:MAG: AI-2E family transporter, partial [Bdellovibrionales bacterium]|nr:AI-2E family transporter [Bdellovibrionales bacterium]